MKAGKPELCVNVVPKRKRPGDADDGDDSAYGDEYYDEEYEYEIEGESPRSLVGGRRNSSPAVHGAGLYGDVTNASPHARPHDTQVSPRYAVAESPLARQQKHARGDPGMGTYPMLQPQPGHGYPQQGMYVHTGPAPVMPLPEYGYVNGERAVQAPGPYPFHESGGMPQAVPFAAPSMPMPGPVMSPPAHMYPSPQPQWQQWPGMPAPQQVHSQNSTPRHLMVDDGTSPRSLGSVRFTPTDHHRAHAGSAYTSDSDSHRVRVRVVWCERCGIAHIRVSHSHVRC